MRAALHEDCVARKLVINDRGMGARKQLWKHTKLECFAFLKYLEQSLAQDTIDEKFMDISLVVKHHTSPQPLQGNTSSFSIGLSKYSSIMAAMMGRFGVATRGSLTSQR